MFRLWKRFSLCFELFKNFCITSKLKTKQTLLKEDSYTITLFNVYICLYVYDSLLLTPVYDIYNYCDILLYIVK